MARPKRFSDHRWLGDKRNQIVHDLDAEAGRDIDGIGCDIDGIVEAQAGAAFGPDLLAEARNRGYRACRTCAPEPRWTDRSAT